MSRVNLKDLIGGALVCAVGVFFFAGAFHMRIGSAMQMGPGYFPMLVGAIVTVVGAAQILMSFARATAPTEIHWRPMLAVLAGVAGFALALSQFGLIPAMFACVVIAALGDGTSKPLSTVVLAVVASIAAWLVFRVGLDLQMPGLKLPAWLG